MAPTSKKYKDKYGPGSVPDGYDVDHVIDLQLGGIDHVCNMRPSMPALIGAWEPDTLSDKGSSRRHQNRQCNIRVKGSEMFDLFKRKKGQPDPVEGDPSMFAGFWNTSGKPLSLWAGRPIPTMRSSTAGRPIVRRWRVQGVRAR